MPGLTSNTARRAVVASGMGSRKKTVSDGVSRVEHVATMLSSRATTEGKRRFGRTVGTD